MGKGIPKRYVLRGLVLLFWLGMIGWLLRYEAFPEYFTRSLAGYHGLLSKDVLVADSWMKIVFNWSG